ncbi:uncharacterized protein [Clytia hemisphaerica]|uniref:Receptor protein-tyrosine kinase n=1 Tax=Clytia hemisphaerica TaxID=252671 RepID=A0A7M5X7T6_9CNID
MKKIFTILLFFGQYIITEASKLDTCGYADNPSDQYDFKTDKWFHIGQLYSYCMQPGNLTTFDADCKTTECKNCMKACPNGDFNLAACISECNSNEHCINGCKFFNQVVGGSDEFLTLAISNTPKIIQDAPIITEYDYNVNYKWDSIVSGGSVNLSSIYLVTTVLGSDQFQSGYTEEKFLMLTTDTAYNLTINDVCQRMGGIHRHTPKKKYQIKIYPINRNGWNRSNALNATFIRKRLPNVSSVEISRPRFYGSANLEWEFTVPPVSDDNATYIKVYSDFQGTRCRSIPLFTSGKSGGQNIQSGQATTVKLTYYDPGKDQLDGCHSDVEIYVFYDCLDAGPFLSNFTYVNCSYVRDYTKDCPYVTPPTLPPPVDVIASYTLSKTTCRQRAWTSDLQEKCSNANYALSLTWPKPSTVYPIQEYLIRWGKMEPWFFPNTSWVFKGKEFGISSSALNTSFLIEEIPLSSQFNEFGIEIHPRTERYVNFRYSKYAAGYTIYNTDVVPQTTFPLEISIEQTGESCTKWSYVPCFDGDAQSRCEECIEGNGIEYTVSWKSENAEAPFPEGEGFLVQWGPAVQWTGEEKVILTSDAMDKVIVNVNKTTYKIRNIKKIVPKLGVRVEVDNVNNTKYAYTTNFDSFRVGLEAEQIQVKVANFTCTNRTITFDSEGRGNERCEHGDYDLLFKWAKPDTNRSVNYMVRWGPRNPRQKDETEALVLKEQKLGDVTTENLSQEIKGIALEKEIGIELHVKTRLKPNYPYSSEETGYTWFAGLKDSLPKPIKQNLEITTKLIKSCQEYEKVECFSGDEDLSCVECHNGTVVYQVTWRKWEKRRRRRSLGEVESEFDDMYLVRWGAAVEYGGQTIVPLDSELGWLRTEANNVTFNISKIHPLMGFQVFAYGDGEDFSVFSENYKFNQTPTQTPPTDSPVSKGKDEPTASIVLGVLIPLIVIAVLIILFIAWRKRDKDNKSPFEKDGFGMYFDAEKGILADDWEIDPKAITLDVKIGEGAFGTVYSATIDAIVIAKSNYGKQAGGVAGFNTENNPKVAVKLLKDGAQQEEFADFKEEITLMKSIGYHKNIVNMIGCSTVRQPMCLLVEFMEHGDLLNFLRKRRSKLCTGLTTTEGTKSFMYTQQFHDTLQDINSIGEESVNSGAPIYDDSPNSDEVLTPDDLLSFAWQVCAGMEFLTSNNMVHRDLAARNVLIGANKVCKVSDFGLTRTVGDSQIYTSQKSRKLPIKWMSVEAIFDQEFTMYSDVWAYGVLLFEIVTLGGTPYPSVNNRELLRMLKSGYRMDKPENCADPMYDIMLHCWNEDPLERPTFTELHDHLEQIMSQSADYLSFDIDQGNTYYNVASFNSVPSDDEDLFMFDAEENAPKIKSIEELKEQKQKMKNEDNEQMESKLSLKSLQPNEERYVKPQPLKSFNSAPNGYVNPAMTKDLSDLTL